MSEPVTKTPDGLSRYRTPLGRDSGSDGGIKFDFSDQCLNCKQFRSMS